MMKKQLSVCLAAALTVTAVAPAMLSIPTNVQAATVLEDGQYDVQIVGYYKGEPSDYAQNNIESTALLTVKDGKQTVKITLKNEEFYKEIKDVFGKIVPIVKDANNRSTITFEGTDLVEKGVTAVLHVIVAEMNYDHHYEMNYLLDDSTIVSKEAAQTTRSLVATAKNNANAKDTVTVKGVQAGDTVRLYNGQQTITKQATSSSVTFTVSQLGKKAGNVHVTVQAEGERESNQVTVAYKAEPVSAVVNAKKVTVKNKKGKANDQVIVKGLTKGDVLRFYDSLGNGLGRVTATSSTATFKTKSLKAKGGKIYISRTQANKTTSKKVAVQYKAEK